MVRRIVAIASLALLIVVWPRFHDPAAAEDVKVGIPSLMVTMMPLAVAKEAGLFGHEGRSSNVFSGWRTKR